MLNDAVDIVISTYGRGAMIDGTIADIRSNTHTDFTLWVLDQSHDDQTERCVMRHAAEDPRIRYRRAPLRGIAATRNLGVQLCSAPIVLFTNDDCRIAPDWIAALLAELAVVETWAVFGRVLPSEYPTGLGADGDVVTVVATKLSEQREEYKGQRFNLGFGHGHNMGVRRERFVAIGGFDELLGGGTLGAWDERDLGYRILRRGGQIVFTPFAVVHHHHWQNWAGVMRSFRNYGIGTGAAVAKYVRCGDYAALYLFLEWGLSQGLRQALSGLLKWRSWEKVQIGISQLFYPWVGLARSFRYECDRDIVIYRER